VAPGSSTANGAAWRDPRGDESLLFQPIERGIDGTSRHGALQAVLDLVQDGAAIAFLPERRPRVRQREEDGLFECTEVFSQVVYIVYNSASRCKAAGESSRSDAREAGKPEGARPPFPGFARLRICEGRVPCEVRQSLLAVESSGTEDKTAAKKLLRNR
jgi:hypothetical protein